DVARRLATLAAPRPDPAGDAATAGWTPRPARTAAPVGPVPPAGAAPTARAAHRVGRVGPRAPGSGDPRPEAGEPAPHATAGRAPAAVPERWDPDVASALALAAEHAPRAPVPVAPRVRWVPAWRTAGAAGLALALVAGGIVLRASTAPRGEPVAIAAPGVTATDGATSPTDADTDTTVVVHVVGAVGAPGVVHLDAGARVADALTAAGGSTPDADLGALNLARVVGDGEQLRVPLIGEAPAAQASAAAPDDALVDLNRADEAALQELPGVGPVLAGRIVEHRARSPFTSVDDLDDVAGIGPALMADLRPRVRV
ncbi:ComEA family DNA-binding protein, partial [Cellulomonas sp. B6]|uniref:ComEA family DNA-binding protein n=1 Tax=Cellulomonas sp. B6 TaxID=1295626 RepID=UPI00073BC972